ncbi:prostaglandin E2 receptor EP2 subtype-like [Lytechinus variegatus]|uniref:prostaglandin E2 receptor EP2 subtype-like n=1 Tax=Lytechinus variegatus TaxID=7654 RepID=UPI001BB250F4|nr:prostaglandin E2 receptor EP2 subtype-like [Lytechinus variegatus]
MTAISTYTSSMLPTWTSDIVLTTSYDERPSDSDDFLGDSTMIPTINATTTQSPPLLIKDNAGKIQTYTIVALGILLNFITLVMYTKTGCSRRRRTTPIMLITALAWIDSLAILSYLGRTGLKPVLHRDKPRIYCNIFGFITNFYPFASGFVVTLMSVERYTALVTPYRYHKIFTHCRTGGAVVFLMLAAAFIGALPLFGIGSYERVPFHGLLMCKLFWKPGDSLLSNVQFAIYITSGWGLLLTVIACNGSVIAELVKMRRKITAMYPGLKGYTGVEVRFVKTTLLVTIVFIACWLPWMIYITYTRIGLRGKMWSDLISHRFLLANHTLDPVVFLLTQKSTPTRLRRIFRCFRRMSGKIDPKKSTTCTSISEKV